MKAMLTCLLFYVSIISLAQERSDHKKFGFKVGVNHTHMNYQRGYRAAGELALASKPMTGLTAGLVLNLPVTHNLSIQPEYLYASRKTSLSASGMTNHFQYLSLPVFLQVKLSNRVFLLGGPQFDLLIHATKNDGKQTVEITHDVEERNLGATGGLQFFFSNKFFIDARYMHGISNVGVGQRSSVQEFKYQSFELTAGIRF